MINKIFDEIKIEARKGKIVLKENEEEIIIRFFLNIVDSDIYDTMPNAFIKDKDNFDKILIKYVYTALNFYNLDISYDNIKKVLAYSLVNITENEMKCLDNYFIKYINFYENNLTYTEGNKETILGNLNYSIEKQSIKQETPYYFKSYFERDGSIYLLPRISFGINNNTCYIYAIQNKDSKFNTNQEYNMEVKNTFKTINSGITKYRNVTPSFVVALVLFISFLKKNGIDRIGVVTPLPLRQNNREESTKQKIRFYTMKGHLKHEDIDKIKKEIIDKKIMDDYNSTVKFVNCFNRLKLHFENLFIYELDNNLLLDIVNLSTHNNFLMEIAREERYNGKISKYSSS